MGKLAVHAGDWPKGHGQFSSEAFLLPKATSKWGLPERVLASNLVELELASEDSVKRLGGAVGWGLVGAAALGPVGLLAGLVAGGKGKNVTFIAKFKDGRKLLATTDNKTFTKIRSLTF